MVPETYWAVVDEESASAPREVCTVLARCPSADAASQWIGDHGDSEKVLRGGYGIDGPCRPEPKQ